MRTAHQTQLQSDRQIVAKLPADKMNASKLINEIENETGLAARQRNNHLIIRNISHLIIDIADDNYIICNDEEWWVTRLKFMVRLKNEER